MKRVMKFIMTLTTLALLMFLNSNTISAKVGGKSKKPKTQQQTQQKKYA